METRRGEVLILCKTYPSPSGKYCETSCVAGVTKGGSLIRLFPVPFRLLNDEQKFKKWQWISLEYKKAQKDHRPESYSINSDAIQCIGLPLSTKNDWAARRAILSEINCFSSFADIERNREKNGNSLALLKPSELIALEIEPVKNKEWTADEIDKLKQQQKQGGLFDDGDRKAVKMLNKLPYSFYYRYACGDNASLRHKIVDWEAGTLFWNCYRTYGGQWEKYFRAKLEQEFSKKDLLFLLGTIHRFPQQWLIISLIYPPKKSGKEIAQMDLFSGF